MNKIGRYEILEKLGFGGMATVYKAHDPQISRTLAIKVLREERCKDEEYRRRFLREAKAVGTLSHQNIVTIYDISEIDNTPYIAMELLDGISLDRLMKSDYKPSLTEILDWSMQLADALEYAHQRGIIHRDIKPSNIVLSHDKKTIKITDFGIAHFDETDVTQHTQLGEVLGTPQYMSPEQVLGKQADARSDLFSVGVIMYQLLTGQKPFHADTLATLLFQIATENPEPIGQIAPDLPSSLKQAVDKLLKKKPEKRFQSGSELKHALSRIINDIKHVDHKKQSGQKSSITGQWLLWSLLSLTVMLAGSGYFLYQQQKDSLTQQLTDQGTALSQFLAYETAEPVLSEDWAAVELFVQYTAEQQYYKKLNIVDHSGIVRGSNQPVLIGTQLHSSNETQSNTNEKVRVNVLQVSEDHTEFEFIVPILFQTSIIGEVQLYLGNEKLEQWTKSFILQYSIVSVIILTFSSMLIVFLSKQLSKPISLLRTAMREIGEGNNAYRIGISRKDELGLLFDEFDNMAVNIQHRDESKIQNGLR